MAKFRNLPRDVLSIVARHLVQNNRQSPRPSLGLLPLRLLHPRFTPAITGWIFRTCLIKANDSDDSDGSIDSDESHALDSRQQTFWNKANLFLPLLKISAFATHVTTLVFTIDGAEDALTSTTYIKLHQCISALLAVRETVRNIHLCGEVVDSPDYRRAWETLATTFPNLDMPFDRLEAVVLGGWYLPLLPRLLRRSPQLSRLHIGSDWTWVTLQAHVYSALADVCISKESDANPVLESLFVEDASKHGTLAYLEKLRLTARKVYLSVSIREPVGLFTLAEGVLNWAVFANVDRVIVCAEEQAHRRLAPLENALRLRKIPLVLEQWELRFPRLVTSTVH